MELIFPGLIVLLVGAVIAFFVVPRFGAPTLAAISLALLAQGVYQHQSLFQAEYRLATWHERLKDFAPFILVGALLIGVFFYVVFLFAGSSSSSAPSLIPQMNTILPSAESATNPVTSFINNSIRTANNVVNRNKVPTGRNTVANLGSILGTPSA